MRLCVLNREDYLQVIAAGDADCVPVHTTNFEKRERG